MYNRDVGWKRGSNSAVECQLPKLNVAGSIPVSRSIFSLFCADVSAVPPRLLKQIHRDVVGRIRAGSAAATANVSRKQRGEPLHFLRMLVLQ